MMIGHVSDLHALILISFQLADGSIHQREFVIDTGFTGYLTLPPQDIIDLELPFRYRTPAYLADHSEIQVPVHDATILWHGEAMEVRVLATGQRPLLGTALLKGTALWAQFVDYGIVEIDEI